MIAIGYQELLVLFGFVVVVLVVIMVVRLL